MMSTGPKAAAFAVLLRVLFEINAPGRFWLVWVSAALSMTLGNVGALVQDNIKRLLAYSSIAHAGYMLVAFAAQPELGTSAVMFYTAAYAAMNVGAFAVVSHFANAGRSTSRSRTTRALAAGRHACRHAYVFHDVADRHSDYRRLLRQILYFQRALKANLVGLTVIGLINSAVGAYYYLRVVVAMYMREPRGEVPVTPVPFATGLAIAACVLATSTSEWFPGACWTMLLNLPGFSQPRWTRCPCGRFAIVRR